MKSVIFLVTIALLFSLNTYSQSYYNKGTYSLAGSIYYTSSEVEFLSQKINTKNIDISPIISYFIYEKFAAGLEFSYNYSDDKRNDIPIEYYSNKRYDATLSIGPILRYYFLDQQVSPFIEIGYNHIIKNLTSYNHLAGFRTRLGTGFDIFLSDAVAIEPNIIYELSNTRNERFDHYYITSSTIKIGLKVNYFIH